MVTKILICFIFVLGLAHTMDEREVPANSTETFSPETAGPETDLKVIRERLDNQSRIFEKALKDLFKLGVKKMLPRLISYSDGTSNISSKCMGGFLKYISGLTNAKVWAVKMFDATSKIASGIFEGTLSDFGAFDQCLELYLPTKSGKIEFRGQYCALEAGPKLLPIAKNFSMAKQEYAKPLDTIGKEVVIAGTAFYYLKFRLGLCIPSTCSLEEMQFIAQQVTERSHFDVKIPQCYVKEGWEFKPVHLAVIGVLSFLLLLCIIGSIIEYNVMNSSSSEKTPSRGQQVFLCFSVLSNFRRLMSPSKGSEELKVLHGLKALSICWVILGHTYVWINFSLLRRPDTIVKWFNSLDFGSILNGWLSVEPFFFLSGLLTCYAAMKILPKTKGKINIPIYILRRYLRLAPPLLLAIGLAFFMPLVSSGPFWYEKIDPEIKSCTKNWWMSLLFISNWFGMKNICMHTTWFLSADFQLHIITVFFLLLLYRLPKLGLSLIVSFVLLCTAMVGVLTFIWDLPPIILISSGNYKQIEQTVDIVHLNTFTHAGPYYVGIVTGYLINKYKDVRMSKFTVLCGWALSAAVSLTSLYGAHRWNIGEAHGPLLTAIYAGLHRTTFTIGVAWVAFACITGYGGLVNRFLSSSILAPVSRLTFWIYLMHCLVIWVRMGSLRERTFYSHYNLLYEYISNVVLSFLITIPFYLLLEAPVSNLERLIFSRSLSKPSDDSAQRGHLQTNMVNSSGKIEKIEEEDTSFVPVELTSVKNLENGRNNLAFNGDIETQKKD